MYEFKKHPLNVEGKYYVDANSCVFCDCCVEIAPNNFVMDKPDYCSYVYKQPSTPEEEKQCAEAMHCCPTEAIFNDG